MTGSPEIRLDKSTLDGAAARMVDARSDFQALSNQLEQDFAELRSSWEGQGGRAFQDVAEKWRESHRIITDQLDRLATDVGANVTIAMSGDDDVAGDLSLRAMSDSLTHR